MEEKKQQRLYVKKTQASVQGKTIEKGGKVGKAKTNGVKSKMKSLPGKRKSTRAPKKTKPAPHVEPGYALYSSLSEESTTQKACVRLLNEVEEKKQTEHVDHHTQFNTRLSSSTPDPDRLLVEFDQQLIPERDTSSPMWKTILTAKHVPAKDESYLISNEGQFCKQRGTEDTNHLVRVPTALSVPLKTPARTSSEEQQIPITPCNQSVAVTQTFSKGFVPIDVGNDRDQESLQQFPDKEILQSGLTFSAGIHSDNHTTPDTSRSGYVSLPQPAVSTVISSQQSVVPLYTQENGLYQLRSQALSQPQVRPQFSKEQTFQSCDIPDLPHGERLFEQFACGQISCPSPVPENPILHQLEGSYLLTQRVIPERDTVQFSVPSLHLSEGHIETNFHDTLSTITGPGTYSPDTARTLTSSGSPRINEQVTPKNSSGSSSSKSVHFQIKDNLMKELSEISKTSHQTQTDSCCLDKDHQFISVEEPASAHSSVNSFVQTHQNAGKLVPECENNSQMVTSFVKSDVPNPWSGVKAKAGMKKLRYCLNELKECGKINKDKEIKRLVKEVEDTLEIIPQLKSTFSLQAEIDLAIQPLRSENAQLRRRLRLLNKQSRGVTTPPTYSRKELARTDDTQLQTKTATLQKALNTEKEEKLKLAAEMKNMHIEMQKMKVERSRLIASASEKETDELMIRQECLSEAHQFRTDLDRLQRQIKGARIQYEALERENHVLQVTLQQKDDEIKDQKNRIEAIKVAVGQVLQELEASTTGGETSVISNNSFCLQRLLHILDGKQTAGFENSMLSDINVHSISSVHKPHLMTYALTSKSLASHNSLQQPARSNRYEEYRIPRDNMADWAPVDYKSSMSDTEVEYQTFDSHKNIKRKSSSQKQRSLSGDGKPVEKIGHRMAKYSDCHGRDGSYLVGIEKKHDKSGNVFMAKSQKLRFEEDDIFPRSDYDNSRRCEETQSGFDTQSKFSTADSRYSVTDYFRKYPSSSLKFQSHSRKTCKTNDSIDASRISKPSIVPRSSDHHRHLGLPEGSVLSKSDGPHFSPPSNPSSHQSTLTQHSITQKSMLSPQDQLYRGTYLDNSISAIDDDNISSVSGRSPSSMSVDERTFKNGIANLDANILKLQLALQKTKSMLY